MVAEFVQPPQVIFKKEFEEVENFGDRGLLIYKCSKVFRKLTAPLTLRLADRFLTRLKGLMFAASIGPDDGLWIVPCRGIHTFLMRFPIDVIFLDRNRRVVQLCGNVQPNRMGVMCLTAESVIECRAGFIARNGITLNHVLEILEHDHSGPRPLRIRGIFSIVG